jgi:hypothetical protein
MPLFGCRTDESSRSAFLRLARMPDLDTTMLLAPS